MNWVASVQHREGDQPDRQPEAEDEPERYRVAKRPHQQILDPRRRLVGELGPSRHARILTGLAGGGEHESDLALTGRTLQSPAWVAQWPSPSLADLAVRWNRHNP